LVSNKNNNNSNQQQQQEQQTDNNNNVNQYSDFFPGFKLQKEQFSKIKTRKGKSWPRAESPFEKRYGQFIIDVINPSNNCFYMPLDENNYPVEMPDKDPRACRHIVNTIVRIRLADGSEKLYSLGQLIGYDGASIRRSMACDKPEVWTKTKFGYEKDYNKKTRRFDVYTTGPMGQETVYMLDFNSDNFQKLYSKTWNGKNEFFKPNRKNIGKRVTLIAKDEQSGIAKEIFFSTLERSIDIFLTRSFSDLITDAYIPRSILEQRRMFSSGYMEEQQKTEPTTNSNTAAAAPSSNNTSAYK
jgi:hypothetical protein